MTHSRSSTQEDLVPPPMVVTPVREDPNSPNERPTQSPFKPAEGELGSAPSSNMPRRYAYLDRMISQFRSDFGFRDRTVKVLDVGGRPVDWNCMYDCVANPLNVRVTLMSLDGEEYMQPKFGCLVGNGLLSLKDIPDQAFDICYSGRLLDRVDLHRTPFDVVDQLKRISLQLNLWSP